MLGMKVVFIDLREDCNYLTKEFNTRGYKTQKYMLPVGDIIYKNICIERKTVDDFIQSIFDGRLWQQAYNMYQNFGFKSFILVAGDWILVPPDKMGVVRGAIARLAVDYGVQVHWTGNEEGLIEFACKLFEKADKPKSLVSIHKSKMRVEEVPVHMLAQVPGISLQRANSLILQFGSLKNIFSILEKKKEELTKAPGIGRKTIEQLCKVYDITIHGDCERKPCHFYKKLFGSSWCMYWVAGRCTLNLEQRAEIMRTTRALILNHQITKT